MSSGSIRLQKRVLLFGRTGQGKSTLANMLVSGKLLKDPVFKMGDGLMGVTESCVGHTDRDHYVIDTVGLGEDPTNHSESGQRISRPGDAFDPAVDQIVSFLESTRTEYSHILFVKAADRFDRLDTQTFKIFKKIFKGAEPAFAVVITKCSEPETWKAKNEGIMKEKYGDSIPSDRYVYVDFPPVNAIPELEQIYEQMRKGSLERLDTALDSFFASNNHKYYKPDYVDISPQDRRKMAKDLVYFILKDIWEYAKQFPLVSAPVEFAARSKEMFDVAFSAVGCRVRRGIREALLSPDFLDQIGRGERNY